MLFSKYANNLFYNVYTVCSRGVHYQILVTVNVELSLVSLQNFPFPTGGRRNIFALTAHQYRCIGTHLLNDECGSVVEAIHMETPRPEDIIYQIYRRWLAEDPKHSWEKLIDCLKKCNLGYLAQQMEDVLNPRTTPLQGHLIMYVLGCYIRN